jgi:hypothetical protein
MGSFETVHAGQVTGTLVMFDRMIFKGHLSAFYKQDGARCFLWTQGVAVKDFAPWAKATTAMIAEHVRSIATSAGRPVIYADSAPPDLRKEELARSIAERDGITEGMRDLGHAPVSQLPGLPERHNWQAPGALASTPTGASSARSSHSM